MNPFKRLVRKTLKRFGFKVIRIMPPSQGPTVSAVLDNRGISSLEAIAASASSIPGMLSEDSGKILYVLCATQLLDGDVVEIGSWQGYSTSFLGRAVRDSRNGTFFAIDHFQGNEGTHDYYVVGKTDLSDLRMNFERNMRSIGIWDDIVLLDMPNSEAAARLVGRSVRFLFIDGDHSRAGVEADIALFFPFLKSGSIVVFDDFSEEGIGLVKAVDALLERQPVSSAFSYSNTLVLVLG